jgi:hypothetical protein
MDSKYEISFHEEKKKPSITNESWHYNLMSKCTVCFGLLGRHNGMFVLQCTPTTCVGSEQIIWKLPFCEGSNTVLALFPPKFLPVLTTYVLRHWQNCKIKPLICVLHWICLPRYLFTQICLIEHKHTDKGQRSYIMMSRSVSVWLICCPDLLFVTEFSVFLQSSALVLYELNLCLGFYWLLRPFNYNILGVSECLWQLQWWPTEGQITATRVS